jgi:hypothetical protein
MRLVRSAPWLNQFDASFETTMSLGLERASSSHGVELSPRHSRRILSHNHACAMFSCFVNGIRNHSLKMTDVGFFDVRSPMLTEQFIHP